MNLSSKKISDCNISLKCVLEYNGKPEGLRIGYSDEDDNTLYYKDVSLSDLGFPTNTVAYEMYSRDTLEEYPGIYLTQEEKINELPIETLERGYLEKDPKLKERLKESFRKGVFVGQQGFERQLPKHPHTLALKGTTELLYIGTKHGTPNELIFVQHLGNANSFFYMTVSDLYRATGLTLEQLSKVSDKYLYEMEVHSNEVIIDFAFLLGISPKKITNQFELEKYAMLLR